MIQKLILIYWKQETYYVMVINGFTSLNGH